MKVTSSWIQEWLGRTMITGPELVEALDRAGMEVEQVNYSKPIDERVVVCSVKKVIQHPGADRLKLVDVETGEGSFRVVCGAPNVRAGLKVPFAQIGAVLPGGETIARAKLRGEVSEGMLCSAYELGLGNDHDGILELDDSFEPGTALASLFPADTIIDLKTPANRFDVLSVWGMAREVSAMRGLPLTHQPPAPLAWIEDASVVASNSEAEAFNLVKLEVRNDLPSPDWMQARLRALGVRPISLIVDITNYVMLEYGQPLHAYDAAKIQTPLQVRRAMPEEMLVTLDGVERVLSPDDLMVADPAGPVGLAGVMGGAGSEVSAETTEIWLEAATFEAALVRKTALRHGLRTEASARFERSLVPELAQLGISRAVELLVDLAAARVVKAVQLPNKQQSSPSIRVPFVQITKMLGFGVSHKEIIEALARLQIKAVHSSKDDEVVVESVPWWRPDIKLGADVIEEVVRVLGYDRVPSTIPSWQPAAIRFDHMRARRRLVRDVLYGAGLFEVMTYSFVSHDQLVDAGLEPNHHLKLKNPLSVEQAYLRSSLLPSHLSVAERNRRYSKVLGFYEISNVFLKRENAELPEEPVRLAITLARPEGAYAEIKGIIDQLAWSLNVGLEVEPGAESRYAPGRAGAVYAAGRRIGSIGQLHPGIVQNHKLDSEMAYCEIDLTSLLQLATPRQFGGLCKFPTIQRDVTLLVDHDVTWKRVKEVLQGYHVEYVGDYIGEGVPEGKRSLTLRVVVALPDRTPTDAEANDVVARVVSKLGRVLKTELRP